MNEKKNKMTDITGRRFDHIIALYPTDKRENNSVVWHCLCDCGNEKDITYNKLMWCHVKSCGCMGRERMKRLNTYLTHVDGTSVDAIRSKKIPTNNTTGVKGVYFVKGKYMAKIVFQERQYYLGKFDSIEDAAMVRKEAENELFDGFADYYDKWKEAAKYDPEWADTHPIRIHVDKIKGRFSVYFLPRVSDMPLSNNVEEKKVIWEYDEAL